MQILNLVLYSHDGNKKIIPFHPDKINLIIGSNDMGKSSIGKIIEYCLGVDFKIPDGVISDCVLWYGLKFELGNQQFFLARKHPKIPPTNYAWYMKIGNPVDIPDVITGPNTTRDSVMRTINHRLGILPDLRLPWPSYDNPTPATIVESLPYCFQYQYEIQSPTFLFHNVVGEYTKTITKHILPYFIGAIPDDKVQQKFELLKIDKEIRALERQLEEMNAIKKIGVTKAKEILLEAERCGIIDQHTAKETTSAENYQIILKQIADWDPSEINLDKKNELDLFQENSVNLRNELNELDKEIDILTSFRDKYTNYEKRLEHQNTRLKPLHLFAKLNGESKKCPLCSNHLEHSIPISDAIKNSIKELEEKLKDVKHEGTGLLSVLSELQKNRERLEETIEENYQKIKAIISQESQTKKKFNDSMNRARASAKADFWFQTMDVSDNAEIQETLNEKKFLNEKISNEVNFDLILQNTAQIFEQINSFINKNAKKLELENSRFDIEFDPNVQKLKRNENGIKRIIQSMSGDGWLGYHIVTILGIHNYFRKNNSPVPNFVFFDQPSQVYYKTEEGDPDDKKTTRLFDFLFDLETENIAQMIITDHVSLPNKRFQDRIVLKLDENNKLIPNNWPKKSTN